MTLEEELRIDALARSINGFGRRRQELTGSLPTVFIYKSGHTAGISVEVYENGYADDNELYRRFLIYTDKQLDETEYGECVAYLEKLAERSPGANQANRDNNKNPIPL